MTTPQPQTPKFGNAHLYSQFGHDLGRCLVLSHDGDDTYSRVTVQLPDGRTRITHAACVDQDQEG